MEFVIFYARRGFYADASLSNSHRGAGTRNSRIVEQDGLQPDELSRVVRGGAESCRRCHDRSLASLSDSEITDDCVFC